VTQRLQFKSFTIDSVSRTAITVPVACHAVALRNDDLANDCTLYDAATSGNSKTLRSGAEENVVGIPTASAPYPSYRFASGDTVCWIQADAGTGPITGTFIV